MAERPCVVFGKALRAARVDRGMTQADLARAAGLHSSHIHLLEAGRREPRFETVLKLGRALEIPADALYAKDVIPDQPLARTLQLRRREIGYTQRQVARRAGLTVSAYGRVERGQTDPAWSTASRIIKALRC